MTWRIWSTRRGTGNTATVSTINPLLNGLGLNPRHWGDRPANNSPNQGTVHASTADDPPQTCAYRKDVAVYRSTDSVQVRYSHIQNWENIRKQKFACAANKIKEYTVIRQDFMPRHTVLLLLNVLFAHLLPLYWSIFLLLWYTFTAFTTASSEHI
jgi:hypothetical protein